LVSGWKKKRYDSVVAKTYLQNYSTGRLEKRLGRTQRFQLRIKAYKNIVVKKQVSGEMHRYIPVLAKNAGFGKIGEKVVQHQAGNMEKLNLDGTFH
jgi:hypothetical protein